MSYLFIFLPLFFSKEARYRLLHDAGAFFGQSIKAVGKFPTAFVFFLFTAADRSAPESRSADIPVQRPR